MSNNNSKNKNSGFILSDMVKRKILDMYKISKKTTDKKPIDSKENESKDN